MKKILTMKAKKTLFLTLIALFGASVAFGQTQVTGTVVDDATNETLPFVTVKVKGTQTGAVTSEQGKFSINVPSAESMLVFSFIGYETLEVRATAGREMAVRLKLSATTLEGVVVDGFRTYTRERATGASATVTSEQLASRHTTNIVDNLEGRVAGFVSYEGRIMIRGSGTLMANADPLLVVDGLPVNMRFEDLNPFDIESVNILKDAAASAMYGARASNGVIVVTTKNAAAVNKTEVNVSSHITIHNKPNFDYADNFLMTPSQQIDFESEHWDWWFNDHASAAANRTTVRNTQEGRASANFSAVQFAHFLKADGQIKQEDLDKQLADLKKRNFAKEYMDNLLTNRVLQEYNVSLRNRTSNFRSNLTFNYRHNNHGNVTDHTNRFNTFFRGSYDMGKWATAHLSVNSILERGVVRRNNEGPFNRPAYETFFNPDGSYARFAVTGLSPYNQNWVAEDPNLRSMDYNVLQQLDFNRTATERQNTRYHGEIEARLIEGFSINTQFVYETERQQDQTHDEANSFVMHNLWNLFTERNSQGEIVSRLPNGGRLLTYNTQGDSWTAKGQLNFDRTFASDHHFNALAGMEFRERKVTGGQNVLIGYNDALQTHATNLVNHRAMAETGQPGSFVASYYGSTQGFSEIAGTARANYANLVSNQIQIVPEVWRRNASGFANFHYTYQNRFNATGSMRYDYANVFGVEAKFRRAPFWSLGASWNLHHEDFMAQYSFVNLLKPRLSYGYTGNIHEGVTSFMTGSTATMSGNAWSPVNSHSGLPVLRIGSPGDPTLQWEQTSTFNIGVEFMLFGSRLRGVVDYYNKNSTRLFAQQILDQSTGFTAVVMNAADMTNNGFELTLAYDWLRPQKRGGLGFTTSLIASYNKNKITHVDVTATRGWELTAGTTLHENGPFVEGYPIRAHWVYQYAGLDSLGVQRWVNSDGVWLTSGRAQSMSLDGIVYAGAKDPKTTLAMENTFTWKGFSLNVMAIYYGGHHMNVQVVQPGPTNVINGYQAFDYWWLDSWTPDHRVYDANGQWIGNSNTPTVYGISKHWSPTNSYNQLVNRATDAFIRPAGFLKIRNIVLGYELPRELASKLKVSQLTLRFQIDNPFTIWMKNDIGFDPERVTGVYQQRPGVSIPTSYILGLNLRF
jgi:TonB-linked SusC/RagA family outer membrane protein